MLTRFLPDGTIPLSHPVGEFSEPVRGKVRTWTGRMMAVRVQQNLL